MVGPFFEVVLADYRQGIDIAKDAEVLNVLATMVDKLGVSTYHLDMYIRT